MSLKQLINRAEIEEDFIRKAEYKAMNQHKEIIVKRA